MLSMAKLIMHRHVRIDFFGFPFVNLAHITSRFLIYFSTYSDDTPNSPYIITSATHPRRHAFVTSAVVLIPGHHFSSLYKYRPLSTIICP